MRKRVFGSIFLTALVTLLLTASLLLAAVLLPWFVRLVELISPKGPELEVISRQIANAHTAFNVCCALLWLPFLPWMVRLVCALVPEDR